MITFKITTNTAKKRFECKFDNREISSPNKAEIINFIKYHCKNLLFDPLKEIEITHGGQRVVYQWNKGNRAYMVKSFKSPYAFSAPYEKR